MVIVLVIGQNFCVIKPGRGEGLLKAINITPSFGGEVKASAPYQKILRQEKCHFEYDKKYFKG
jgi:hypothetical protein